MKKSIITILLIFSIVILLSGCTRSSSTISWTFEDGVLDWNDVEGAAYYKLNLYDDDLISKLSQYSLVFSYDSEYSFYRFSSDTIYNVIITVYYEDGTSEDSDFITVSIDRDFQYPFTVSRKLEESGITWYDLSDLPGFINYTLKINDEELIVDQNEFDMFGYDSEIFKIQVKANYTDGSSTWTRPYYSTSFINTEYISVYYDLNSSEDFTYTFDDSVIIDFIQGDDGIDGYGVLSDSIVSIDGSTITVNQYYIHNEMDPNLTANNIIVGFTVITNSDIYIIHLQNNAQ